MRARSGPHQPSWSTRPRLPRNPPQLRSEPTQREEFRFDSQSSCNLPSGRRLTAPCSLAPPSAGEGKGSHSVPTGRRELSTHERGPASPRPNRGARVGLRMKPSIYLGGKERIKCGLDEAHSHKCNNFSRQIPKALAVSNSPCPLAQMDQTSRSQILFYIKMEGAGGGTSVEQNNVTQLNSVN